MIFAEGITIDSAYALMIFAGAGGVIALLFRLLISAKDKELTRVTAELEARNKSYQEIAAEAIKSATETTNYYRKREGKPPLEQLVPVIPESNSPSTQVQRDIAQISTMRADIANIKLVTGQPPKKEPDHAKEK